jgi:hypothetical protein
LLQTASCLEFQAGKQSVAWVASRCVAARTAALLATALQRWWQRCQRTTSAGAAGGERLLFCTGNTAVGVHFASNKHQFE